MRSAPSAGWPAQALLRRYQPHGEPETADVRQARELAAAASDPWLRTIPLHLTASALVVHPDSGRMLLRWHVRQQAWLHTGGHGDPGETDPVAIALREAQEETSLPDLAPWPDAQLLHVAVVPVPASTREPAHQHGDLRFVFATAQPGAAQPETPAAPLRWLAPGDALALTTEANFRETITRAQRLLAG